MTRESITQGILEAWKKHPHLRLGQFIVNALNLKDPNLYYATDEWLLERLTEYPKNPPIPPGLISET